MSPFATYIERNNAFAHTDAHLKVPEIPFIPFKQTFVITCLDPRVEPAAILGVELGEAIVLRNVGGRVTPATLRDVAWIGHLHEAKTPDADWFELAVIHHTDCGSALFADDELRRDFVSRGGYDDSTIAALAVLDPAVTVRRDVDLLRSFPLLSADVEVSGHVYDLRTGLLTTVVRK
ncbi:carbonic anhydrase [Streptomyces xanthochromogenes]|uniref:carbonic anhydrase n=1 Tax=Streptomyces xanthochromogenes TaxID=67384 RepID=UPI0019ADFB36|nr:carbonic anhydrase [Streptomyces xanthochromogenes]GHB36100.1 carbonic anhydrase [Streptomyces xanthochromogenes]